MQVAGMNNQLKCLWSLSTHPVFDLKSLRDYRGNRHERLPTEGWEIND